MLSSTTVRATVQGSGSAGPFAFPFKIFAASDLLVKKTSVGGGISTLAYPTDYTVSGVGDASGGTLTLTVALATGETLAILRATPLTQNTSLRSLGTFFPGVLEDALDRLTMLVQQHDDAIKRSARVSSAIDPSAYTMELTPVTGQVLGWSSPTTLSSFTLDASAIGVPGGGRTVATATAYLANNAVFNVRDFGTTGNGVADDRAAVNLAATTAAAAGAAIIFWPGTYRIASNLTISVPVIFAAGAKLSVDTGVTVTLTNDVSAGLSQIMSGLGTLSFLGNKKVRDFHPHWWGALWDNATDDTAAIQKALDAQNTAKAGTVRLPAGQAKYTTLTYHKATRMIGHGASQFDGSLSGTVLMQIAGTADVLLKPDALTGISMLYMADFQMSAFQNTASNTGGILIQGVNGASLERVCSHDANNWCFRIQGGSVAGDSMYNVLRKCFAYPRAGGAAYQIDGAFPSWPDGTMLDNCWATGGVNERFIYLYGTALNRSAGGCTFIGNQSIGIGIVYESWGTLSYVVGNRFEVTAGAMTVNLWHSTEGNPCAFFIANSFAQITGLNWNDQPATVDLELMSPRIGYHTTNMVPIFDQSGHQMRARSFAADEYPLTYGANVVTDVKFGLTQVITVTDGNAFSIVNPINVRKGAVITFRFMNTSGGAMGAVTFGSAFKLPTAGWAMPANGFNRAITFECDGAVWRASHWSTADVDN